MSKGIILPKNIKDRIYTIRGVQVMLDRDLAELYGVATKRLNEQVKRNLDRFPENFMFQLKEGEKNELVTICDHKKSNVNLKSQNATSSDNSLRSQNATLNQKQNLMFQSETSSWGGTRKPPYVFTEQGVAMLSGVLRSKTAIDTSIQIINAFVTMRKFISKNMEMFFRLDKIERKQIEYDDKFEKVFDALETHEKKQGIFFNGQIFDAHTFISDLIRNANNSIILIDNFIDDSVLTLFSKRKKGVKVTLYTKTITEPLKLDLKKYNSQYEPIEIKEFKDSHDRFIIIDKEAYHFGASLKDLGKKWFAFSKFTQRDLIIDRLYQKV